MDFRWKPYVRVAARRKKAMRTAEKLAKKGQTLAPVTARGGAIAKTFWGKAWCRNGSVIDLQIEAGDVSAQVMGSSLYRIRVKISAVTTAHWQGLARDCARSIDTLVELLQGRLSTSVMERITRPGTGLFPSPMEISFCCTCPDSAAMCKHVAATLYGIGARLDTAPEMLFRLRNVDAHDLIALAGEGETLVRKAPRAGRILDSSKLGDIFGIDLAGAEPSPKSAARSSTKTKRSSASKKPKAADGGME
jgi:uncharacterized Zn finger protein